MRGITSLPVETLSQIFKDVATLYKGSEPTTSEDCSQDQACFPFNAANTCLFWLEILKSKPQIWKSVSIDVAKDPTPFLDTLGLFKDGPIDVTIFSSFLNTDTLPSGSEINEDTQKHCENTRAQAVFSRLEPLIARCERIVFELIYQSSLPSAAKILVTGPPSLRELFLDCQIYDLDDDESSIEFEKPHSKPNISLPCLIAMSLTGYAFMEFYQIGLPKALAGCAIEGISINHLKLHGQDTGSSTRSLATFMGALEEANCYKLSLSDISLDSPAAPRTRERYDLAVFTFDFENVSSSFISAFLPNIDFDSDAYQHDFVSLLFSKCSLPHIAGPLAEEENFSSVDFSNIPSPESGMPNNLTVLAKLFNPMSLRLIGCDGITDDFFDQLSRVGEEQGLMTLFIGNCTHFTPRALISFLKTRESGNNPLLQVQVYGKGPKISAEEAAWFPNQGYVSESNQGYRYVWEARCDVVDINE